MDADLVNARNLAQFLWSVAKLGNPEACDGEVLTHPEKGLREIGPLRFGNGAREKGGASLPEEVPSQVCGFCGFYRTMWCIPSVAGFLPSRVVGLKVVL